MFDVKRFGANIAKLRKDRDMTQSELADRLNLTRQAISKYELGESFPDISILVLVAETFGISLQELIGLGEPTKGEAKILENIARGTCESGEFEISDVINMAPLIKPSLLDKMARGLSKQGIDISNITALAEFLSDKGLMELLENANFDSLNEELVKKLAPFLDDDAKSTIVNRIIDGEYDWHILKIILPHFRAMNLSVIEAAVVDGALPQDALDMLNNHYLEKLM